MCRSNYFLIFLVFLIAQIKPAGYLLGANQFAKGFLTLGKGLTIDTFQKAGKQPIIKQEFMMHVSQGSRFGLQYFNIFISILSLPQELEFRGKNNLITFSVDNKVKENDISQINNMWVRLLVSINRTKIINNFIGICKTRWEMNINLFFKRHPTALQRSLELLDSKSRL